MTIGWDHGTEQLYGRDLTVIAAALILACVAVSVGYRTYLAKGMSDAAQSACADHNTFSEA